MHLFSPAVLSVVCFEWKGTHSVATSKQARTVLKALSFPPSTSAHKKKGQGRNQTDKVVDTRILECKMPHFIISEGGLRGGLHSWWYVMVVVESTFAHLDQAEMSSSPSMHASKNLTPWITELTPLLHCSPASPLSFAPCSYAVISTAVGICSACAKEPALQQHSLLGEPAWRDLSHPRPSGSCWTVGEAPKPWGNELR